MRVLQLIDSLRPGGAEKMAVNIANALLPHVDRSYLCCTRKEGLLKEQLKPAVGYFFLSKCSSLDPRSILRLRNYIKENKITIVHAHSTSYFLAGLLKLSGGTFKLIWHDHYGESENLEYRKFKVLKQFSSLFAGIISVNNNLKHWAIINLNCKSVTEIKNFIPEPNPNAKTRIFLKGKEKDFKIICVANLRPQKDHLNLLKAFELLEPNLDVSLHLIGVDPDTSYSASIFQKIKNSPSKSKIFYYGTQELILPLLQQSDLGILASHSEGLPLALLEYGMAGLPVVCTSVGNCSEVIGKHGKLVEKNNPKLLAENIKMYYENASERELDATNFNQFIRTHFTQKVVIYKILDIYFDI